ncbi:TPA: hypothetical protein I7142_23400 [Vibrio vulnificus]|nr:hypothetical protein [Vibrio parahaemolyticus]EHD1698849.1 hypothetical protein [Vibrio vulnificus]ELC9582638.1 hypothetical protein [Vibrio vulnificus]MCU8149841.1 hypothetical protein [Vibrio vulnificus]MCU8385878.1 hypothetical protein [Vibrio vulnificus]HAS6026895.1 hypothetical protein [Vibrio vulnificus]
MQNRITSIEVVLESIQTIENKIESLKSALKMGQIIHASLAQAPFHTVDEHGWDSVYDPIEAMPLERHYNLEAFNIALEQLGFAKRHQKGKGTLSQIAARRSVGIIHVAPRDAKLYDEIRELVQTINELKRSVKADLKILFPSTMERSRKFFNKYYPQFLPKSITRLIQIAPPSTIRVTFSWLNKGYSTEKLNREQTESFIDRINRAKLSNNPELSFDIEKLNKNDISRLSHYKQFYRMLPAKLNPRQQITIIDGDKKRQLAPQRAVIPLLVIQSTALKSYHELTELNSITNLRLCKNKKIVFHRPAIEEYGLYAWDGREHKL